MRALIADDNPEVRWVLSSMLKELGYNRVDQVCDGWAAHCLAGIDYAVVLVDVHMGKDVGTEAAHLMKAMGSKAKIILMSGFAEDIDTNGFPLIQKPFNMEELAKVIASTDEDED